MEPMTFRLGVDPPSRPRRYTVQPPHGSLPPGAPASCEALRTRRLLGRRERSNGSPVKKGCDTITVLRPDTKTPNTGPPGGEKTPAPQRLPMGGHFGYLGKINSQTETSDSYRGQSSVMPTEEEEAPSITEFHSSTHVLPVGQAARYTCHAGGTPEPTVEWLHNGRPLERDGTDDQSEAWVERGFLFVRGVGYGVNTVCCMASNSAGTANHSAELLVFDACELTLDPNTAYDRLSLSEDNRKVTGVGKRQSYPDHPERFESHPQVLGREALTGHCYWEVERKGLVYIGVTQRGIKREKGGRSGALGQYKKSWVLYCYDGRYSAMYNVKRTAPPLRPAGSTRVGVYLDRPAGTLSFYRVSPGGGGSSDTLTHIYTFQASFTQETSSLGLGYGRGDQPFCVGCRKKPAGLAGGQYFGLLQA
ncbi:uncharacterized protein LOC130402245 [Gadus chalcogrammus]|uniref:uncharacterized protein LOC130402245 n=1 Tax=Gadus chalcogrammus TaxID=1042646 RepID=UPI0024C47505|nr:uncharacterized protein LOC130402245 [Gadus chalcogrammus]